MSHTRRWLLTLPAALLTVSTSLPAPLQAQDAEEAPAVEAPETEAGAIENEAADAAQPTDTEDAAPADDAAPDMAAPDEVAPTEAAPDEAVPEETPAEEMTAPAEEAPAEEAPAQEEEPDTMGVPAVETPGAQPALAAGAAEEQIDPAVLKRASQLWVDFNHYFRIARPDLAQAAATALMNEVDDATLLRVIETGDYPDWEATLDRAERVETLREVTQQLRQRVQQARLEVARNAERIIADIERLDDGARARANAMARLRAAGQYAAPHLLSVLLDDRQRNLHPYVLRAMVEIGRPLVYHLSVALPNLEPVPQGQIAQVLTEIGYERALPYLRQVLDDPQTDPTAARVVQVAFNLMARAEGVPQSISAAELFLTLANNHYDSGSTGVALPGFEPGEGQGLVWAYNRRAGLVPIPVPAPIFPDVLAMRAARTALELNPEMDAALSLWLGANLRRENRLPEGANDLSYPEAMQPAIFYAEMAGPLRLHDVLHRALGDNDPALGLDAIQALGATAGTDALINREGTVQPLLRALSYPDRRVRIWAAYTMTNARPQTEFPGSHRVVPVLAEAVRQSDVRYAVVLGRDRETANRLAAVATELGYQPISGQTLQEVMPQIESGPGVDLILIQDETPRVEMTHRQAGTDFRLGAVPILALTTPGQQVDLAGRYPDDPRLRTAVVSENAEELRAAIEQTASAYAGAGLSPEEAHEYALTALRLLREVALGTSGVFNAADAQAALIDALGDERPQIANQAARVLALISSADAQQAIATAALDTARDEEVRVGLLGSLAESATNFGNNLAEPQVAELLRQVETSQGDLAIAAARAHGALTLPTSQVVQLIAPQPQQQQAQQQQGQR